MLKEFREFILRGNVIDLAIAVIIGAAFGAVVTSAVNDIFTPLIAAIVGEPSFGDLVFNDQRHADQVRPVPERAVLVRHRSRPSSSSSSSSR